MTLELHPLCTLFPRMSGAEFDALKADIVANGMREPIVVHAGLILDGGNRYRACIDAGVEPALKEFTGNSAVLFVLSANLHRRHLTPGQQAAIVASAQDWSRAHTAGGDRKSDQAATLPFDSVAGRAAQSGASERTQRMADSVARQSPDLARQVAHGEISLPKALEQLTPKPSAVTPQQTPPPSASATVVVNQVAEGSDLESDPLLDDDDHFDRLIEENKQLTASVKALHSQVADLQAHVTLLKRDDLANQVDVLTEKCARLDSLARSRHADVNDAMGEVAKKKAFIDMLRSAAKIGKDGDLLEFVKRAAGREA